MTLVKRVLMIDDQREDYEVVRKQLADFDVCVEYASELEEAMDKLASSSYSVLLVDLLFINPNDKTAQLSRGLEIIRNIKHRYPTQELILLTNNWKEEPAVKAMKQDAYSAIRKGDFKLLLAEVRNASLKHAIAEVEIPRADIQEFFTSEELSPLLRDLYSADDPASLFCEIVLLFAILENHRQLNSNAIRIIIQGTKLGHSLPSLNVMGGVAIEQLREISQITFASKRNRSKLASVAAEPTFCLTVHEGLFIRLVMQNVQTPSQQKINDKHKMSYLLSFLRNDGGLRLISGRLAVDCLLNRSGYSLLSKLNLSALLQLKAGDFVNDIEAVLDCLREHSHSKTFARELTVLTLLVSIQRKYKDLCDISSFPLEHDDWLATFRDQMMPILADSRELLVHLVAFPELAKAVENCQILLARFNRMFVEFLWDETKGYEAWIRAVESGRRLDRPRLTIDVVPEIVVPSLAQFERVLFIVFDGMSLLSWCRIRNRLIGSLFDVQLEDAVFAMLPTATRYARTALFAGKLPRYVVPQDTRVNPNERQLVADCLIESKSAIRISERHFMKYEESIDNAKDLRKKQELRELLSTNAPLSVIIFDPNDKITHVAPGYAEDFAELFYEKTIHPIMEEIAKLRDTAVVITADHGFCEVRRLRAVKGIFSNNVRESDFKYAPHDSERRGHFGKRYIDLGERVYRPRHQLGWLRTISQPLLWGLPDTNGFLIATEDSGFGLEEGETRMFAHGGAAMEEMVVPLVVLKTK